jgi:methanethiol S-methyltransferase
MEVQAHRPSAAITAFAWTGAAVFAASLGWFLYCYMIRFGADVAPGSVVAPVLLNILLFSVFALHHSVLARSGAKTAVRRLVTAELERSLYTWVASLLFILVCALWQPVPGTLYQLDGVWAIAGYAIQGAGLVLTLRAASAVDALDLAGVRPVLNAARGTPVKHVPLATRGLYGFVRHPLYFGWTLLVFGAPVMTATRFTFAIVSTLYLALAIPWEERDLLDVFGEQYESYRRQVRWRMLPGIY